jgi:hypothetical protein
MLEGAVPTLVAAAYPPELDGLALLLGAEMASGRVVTRALGVGLIESSAGAERAIAELRPRGIDRIVLVGTAGVLPGVALPIGAVAVARRATLVVRAVEYVPPIMSTQVDADAELTARFAGALGVTAVTVACPVGVTCDDAEAARIAATGAELEHLECFAVLAAAARAGIAATAVFAIANTVGSNARKEWLTHRKSAEEAAQRALAKVLQID